MASRDNVTMFVNATILDGTESMKPQRGMAVTVEAGKIARIEPAAVAQAPATARVIDLGGAFLMPGLVNMHVHFCGSGKPMSSGDAGSIMSKLDNPVGRAILRRIIRGSARQQLASGVTTVRGAGDPLYADIAVRDAIEAGRYVGPRIVAPERASRCRAVMAPDCSPRWPRAPSRRPSRCARTWPVGQTSSSSL